jgi:hypothetical protein
VTDAPCRPLQALLYFPIARLRKIAVPHAHAVKDRRSVEAYDFVHFYPKVIAALSRGYGNSSYDSARRLRFKCLCSRFHTCAGRQAVINDDHRPSRDRDARPPLPEQLLAPFQFLFLAFGNAIDQWWLKL